MTHIALVLFGTIIASQKASYNDKSEIGWARLRLSYAVLVYSEAPLEYDIDFLIAIFTSVAGHKQTCWVHVAEFQ